MNQIMKIDLNKYSDLSPDFSILLSVLLAFLLNIPGIESLLTGFREKRFALFRRYETFQLSENISLNPTHIERRKHLGFSILLITTL